MFYLDFLSFLSKNFLFSFTIVFVSFILGWFLYNKLVLREICLKDALFSKDNLAAWIEFIGAFIFPTLFLAAKAIEGPAQDNIYMDLGICTLYLVVYMVVFTVLRLVSGGIVSFIGVSDSEGKVSLNNEIYRQRNVAAALFSVALSTVFTSVVRFLDVLPSSKMAFFESFLRMSDVLSFTLLAFIVYCLMMRRKTTLFKEIFVDNNVAAGVVLLGFVFAVEIILDYAVLLQTVFNFFELAAMSFVSLVIFGVLIEIFKYVLTKLIKVDLWHEVYEQNNIGAAIGQAALYIGIAYVIVHFLK